MIVADPWRLLLGACGLKLEACSLMAKLRPALKGILRLSALADLTPDPEAKYFKGLRINAYAAGSGFKTCCIRLRSGPVPKFRSVLTPGPAR